MEREIFSPAEKIVLEILGKRKMTISEITMKYYKTDNLDDRRMPLKARNLVASVVRNISSKCQYHKLPWTVNGEGGGRGGRTVWREKR